MVALYNGFTHDASAHTSYLFIVKDRFYQLTAFRSSVQHDNLQRSLSVAAASVDSVLKNLTPVLERAAHYKR